MSKYSPKILRNIRSINWLEFGIPFSDIVRVTFNNSQCSYMLDENGHITEEGMHTMDFIKQYMPFALFVDENEGNKEDNLIYIAGNRQYHTKEEMLKKRYKNDRKNY